MKSDAQYGSAKLQPGSNRNPYHYDEERTKRDADRAAMPQRLADALENLVFNLAGDQHDEHELVKHYPRGAVWAITSARTTLAAYAAMKEAR